MHPSDPFLIRSCFSLYLLSALLHLGELLLPNLRLHRTALGMLLLGFALQTLLLGWRWGLAGFLPVTNLFGTLFFFSWSLAAVHLYFDLRYRLPAAAPFTLPLLLLLLGAALPLDPALPSLIPALDTPLFTLHIVFSFLGYALFTMAFALGVLYLVQRRRASPRLPDLADIRRLNEEAILLGFSLFTLCMVSGSLWAYVAWGYYFSWNIKGVWSFLVWLFYAGMCHAKFIRRWQGTGYALLSIAGFGVVLFTYLGIGLLLESNHPLE